jgi:hypothetical protein
MNLERTMSDLLNRMFDVDWHARWLRYCRLRVDCVPKVVPMMWRCIAWLGLAFICGAASQKPAVASDWQDCHKRYLAGIQILPRQAGSSDNLCSDSMLVLAKTVVGSQTRSDMRCTMTGRVTRCIYIDTVRTAKSYVRVVVFDARGQREDWHVVARDAVQRTKQLEDTVRSHKRLDVAAVVYSPVPTFEQEAASVKEDLTASKSYSLLIGLLQRGSEKSARLDFGFDASSQIFRHIAGAAWLSNVTDSSVALESQISNESNVSTRPRLVYSFNAFTEGPITDARGWFAEFATDQSFVGMSEDGEPTITRRVVEEKQQGQIVLASARTGGDLGFDMMSASNSSQSNSGSVKVLPITPLEGGGYLGRAFGSGNDYARRLDMFNGLGAYVPPPPPPPPKSK